MSKTNCWNLRVNVELNQGGRKYMEDVTSVKFERSRLSGQTIEYAAFAVYDGHGGKEAACFARDHLLNYIKEEKGFFLSEPFNVKKAISNAFEATHDAMRQKVDDWPKTALGHASTAGTTASLVIIRGNKLYVANVGDSMVVMGTKQFDDSWNSYQAVNLTVDHKPDLQKEKKRIELCGGCVINKCGVNRVVWSRPQLNHNGPVRRSTKIDKIPFLAVSRSLGDLWSFNSELDKYVVSPIPDVYDYELKHDKSQFIILASDGLWNMLSPTQAVQLVAKSEHDRKKGKPGAGAAHDLVKNALHQWKMKKLRADNTSVITVFIERIKLTDVELKRELYSDTWASGENRNVSSNPVQVSTVASTKEEDEQNDGLNKNTSEPVQDCKVSSSSSIKDLAPKRSSEILTDVPKKKIKHSDATMTSSVNVRSMTSPRTRSKVKKEK